MLKKLCILFLILFYSCDYLSPLKLDKELKQKIETTIKLKNHVNLLELTHFEWDEVTCLIPYSNIEDVEKEYNLDLSNMRHGTLQYSDVGLTLIFLKEKKSVKIIRLNRSVNFSNKILKKENNILIVNNNGSLLFKENIQ